MGENMQNSKLCLERDGHRCRTCGSSENLSAAKLTDRNGEVSYNLSNLVTLCDVCVVAREEIKNYSRKNRVGVLLCGGKGTRLYPLTRTTNKHLLPVGIVPMAFHPIKTLRSMGVQRVLIIVDQCASAIMETIGSGKMFGMDFSYKVQDGAFGIADALYLAKDYVNEDTDEIVVMLGDNIFDNDAVDADVDLTFHDGVGELSHEACVYIKQVPNPEDYGIAVISDNAIDYITEKPKEFVGDMAVLGLYVYNPSVFEVIDKIEPSKRGELEISAVNDYYAQLNKLDYRVVNGYWADCGGSIQRYTEASLYGAKQANISEEEINTYKSTVFDSK